MASIYGQNMIYYNIMISIPIAADTQHKNI